MSVTNPSPLSGLRILTKKELQKKVPYTPQQILRMEKEGRFPARVQLGPNRVGWIEHEVDDWIVQRMSERRSSTLPPSLSIDAVTEFVPEENDAFITVAQLMKELDCPAKQIDWLEETQRIPPRRTGPEDQEGWYQSELEAWREKLEPVGA